MSFSVHFGFLGVWIFSCALSLSVPHSEKSTLVGNEGYEVGESSGCCQTDLAAGGMVLGFRQQNGGSSSSKERDDAGSLLERYLYGHDLVARESSTGLRSFYSYDGHGSVRGVTSSNGLVEEEFDYDAFGVLLGAREWDDVSGQMVGVAEPLSDGYFYSGERWDSDLGMYYLRARYLNAGSGRFHTMDDYEGRRGEPITLHKYLYGNVNPVSYVDPSGYSGELTLGGQSAAIGLTLNFTTGQASLTLAASWITGKAVSSRWQISLWLEGWHMAISAENIKTNRVWHYDWFERAERGALGAIRCGYIQKYPGFPAGGFRVPSAIFLSDLAFKLWEKTFGFNEPYQEIGNGSYNCWTWALKAQSVAAIYSLIPF